MRYKIEFTTPGDFRGSWANTLNPSDIGTHPEPDGWTVEGEIHEDYCEWVNEFKATHPKFGIVEGNFESEVTATSKEAYDHFIQFHPPNEWDYWDI